MSTVLCSLELVPKDVLDILNDSLFVMYLTLLRMIILCHCHLPKNTVKRAAHAFPNPTETSDFVVKCVEAEKRVERDAHNRVTVRGGQADEKSMKLLEIMEAPILRTGKRVRLVHLSRSS
jgi:hypothetical protein